VTSGCHATLMKSLSMKKEGPIPTPSISLQNINIGVSIPKCMNTSSVASFRVSRGERHV